MMPLTPAEVVEKLRLLGTEGEVEDVGEVDEGDAAAVHVLAASALCRLLSSRLSASCLVKDSRR